MADNKQDEWHYVVIWEFIVQPGQEQAFERVYGAEGDWTELFRQSDGYCGTKLNRDLNNPRRYLTLDFWKSPAVYDMFKSQHASAYKAMDEKCEGLTEQEREIGKFEQLRLEN